MLDTTETRDHTVINEDDLRPKDSGFLVNIRSMMRYCLVSIQVSILSKRLAPVNDVLILLSCTKKTSPKLLQEEAAIHHSEP